MKRNKARTPAAESICDGKENEEWSAPFIAVESEDSAALASWLKKTGADAIAWKGRWRSPLGHAARRGWAEGVSILLDAGLDPNERDKNEFSTNEPLLCMAWGWGMDDVALLLEKAGAETPTECMADALTAVCRRARAEGWAAALSEARRVLPENGDPMALRTQGAWLFIGSSLDAGSFSEEDADAVRLWIDELERGREYSKEVSDCIFNAVLGAARDPARENVAWKPSPGKNLTEELSLKWASRTIRGGKEADRVVSLLGGWSLDKGDPWIARGLAKALEDSGFESASIASLSGLSQSIERSGGARREDERWREEAALVLLTLDSSWADKLLEKSLFIKSSGMISAAVKFGASVQDAASRVFSFSNWPWGASFLNWPLNRSCPEWDCIEVLFGRNPETAERFHESLTGRPFSSEDKAALTAAFEARAFESESTEPALEETSRKKPRL